MSNKNFFNVSSIISTNNYNPNIPNNPTSTSVKNLEKNVEKSVDHSSQQKSSQNIKQESRIKTVR